MPSWLAPLLEQAPLLELAPPLIFSLCINLRSSLHYFLFMMWNKRRMFFNTCISNFPLFLLNIPLFVIKKLSFPNQISASTENQFTVCLWTHFWTLLIHGSLWPSVYQYLTLDFCSLKIKSRKSSFKENKTLFMLYPLHFHVNFERLSVSTKKKSSLGFIMELIKSGLS